jgi:hypothetical protein
MKGQGSSVALVALWILGWGVGGSLIDAGLIKAEIYSLEGGQVGTLITFVLWSLLWGGLGLKLWRRRSSSASEDAKGDETP